MQESIEKGYYNVSQYSDIPSDADRHVKTNWVRNSTLVDYLKEIDSRHTLLITDACFGGSIFKTRTAFGSEEKAFEKLYDLPSRKAMTSGNLRLEAANILGYFSGLSSPSVTERATTFTAWPRS